MTWLGEWMNEEVWIVCLSVVFCGFCEGACEVVFFLVFCAVDFFFWRGVCCCSFDLPPRGCVVLCAFIFGGGVRLCGPFSLFRILTGEEGRLRRGET